MPWSGPRFDGHSSSLTYLYVLPELRSMFQTIHRNTVKRGLLASAPEDAA